MDRFIDGFVYEFGGDKGEVVHVGFGGGGKAEGPEGKDFDVGPVVVGILDGVEGVLDALAGADGPGPAGVVVPAGFGDVDVGVGVVVVGA